MAEPIFIEQFYIHNYKGFKELTASNFSRINLITGKNNVGKTSFLEALFLSLGPTNPRLCLNILARRGIDRISTKSNEIGYLFSNLNNNQTISLGINAREGLQHELKIRYSNKQERKPEAWTNQPVISSSSSPKPISLLGLQDVTVIEFEYIPAGRYSPHRRISSITIGPEILDVNNVAPLPFADSVFVGVETQKDTSSLERYTALDKQGKIPDFEKHLQTLEPKLIRTSIGVQNDRPLIMADVGFGLVPLSLVGSGMGRLTTILLAIASFKDGVVLIDEVETSFHHSTLSNLWTAIAEFSTAYNTQVIATTHSYECITAAHEALTKKRAYDLSVHRLTKWQDNIEFSSYKKDEIASALEFEYEIR